MFLCYTDRRQLALVTIEPKLKKKEWNGVQVQTGDNQDSRHKQTRVPISSCTLEIDRARLR
jgi:hypothetical protein